MFPPPKEVFGTKVCDADGNPLVVYHGTTASFERFSIDYLLSAGLHFGCCEQANYRIFGLKNARIFPVYLNIRELLDFSGSDLGWERPATTAYALVQCGILTIDQAKVAGLKETDTLQTSWLIDVSEPEAREQNGKLATMIASKGYDGIRYSNMNEPKDGTKRDAYVVFNTKNIFSAFTGRCLG
jgi:hypothetical protein